MEQSDRIIEAVLSKRAADLAALLRTAPDLAVHRFDADRLVERIPHQLYAGDTPLHFAAAAVRPVAVKTLLEAGAEVDASNRRGARPMHYACDPRPDHGAKWRPDDQDKLMAVLLTHGADPDAPDKSGAGPLHRAVRARSPGAVRVLLEAGCKARVKAGKAGSTPLHLAIASTGASGTAGRVDLQLEVIALLLSYGASFRDKDAQGASARDRLRSAPLRRALVERGLLD